MKVTDTYLAEITDFGLDGKGFSKIEDIAVFTPYTATGDLAKIKIKKVYKGVAEADAVKIVRPASCRVVPPCKTYGECGGCVLQHVDFPTENELKRKLLQTTLNKAGINVRVSDTVFDKEYEYRNKLQMPFNNERGTVNMSVRVSDITVRKEHLRILALNDINNELDEKEIDSWIRLTRVLTHEIMNAVTPITSLSDTLLGLTEAQASKEEIRNGLQTISSTGKGLLSFVESYRKFTRIPTPEPSLFYVKSFIERMVELARHQHPDVRVTFHTDIAPSDLILYADENLVSQVVINLLKNAIQAIESDKNTDKEGHINIRAYCNEAEAILIEISNNGPAIPNDIAEHIFIPFFTTKEGGSGIGLSISRQIMRLSGGNLSLLPGKETTFILKFN